MARRDGAMDQLWDGERNHRQDATGIMCGTEKTTLLFKCLIVIIGSGGLLF